MNPIFLLSAAAGLWWLSSVTFLLLSFVAVLLHPLRKRRPRSADRPGVTAIVPVKDLHGDFEEAQHSLLAQNYPNLEVLFAACESDSPALAAVERLRQAFPLVRTRIVRSRTGTAASPKLDTLWPALCEARHDSILTKDSNLTLAPGELEDLVGELAPGVGLVSTIAIAREPLSFSAWIEAAILNNFHARVLMLADAAGLGFGLGKIMLFRRSDLMRAGGYECLSWALGEDMALARTLHRVGLRTVLASRVSSQALGSRTFAEVWQRQLRWMIVWRVQLPAAFVADLLGSAAPTALAGAAAATLTGVAPWFVAACTLAGWFAVETLLCAAKRWPLSPLSLPAFLAREIVTPLLWLRACTTREVVWAGSVRRARPEPRRRSILRAGIPRGAPR
ncbi:MAG: glycosyltransferase [Rhizomicrobium sp.]